MTQLHTPSTFYPNPATATMLIAAHARWLRTLLVSVLAELDAVTGDREKAARFEQATPPAGFSMYDEVRRFEAELIKQALQLTGGHQLRAARLLGIKATTLNSKIGRYGIPITACLTLVPTDATGSSENNGNTIKRPSSS